jgi:TorA maturation chaperone TorD
MTQSNVNWRDTLTGQALSFSVLAKLTYEYPEIQWLNTLIAEEVFAEIPFAGAQPDVIAGLALLQTWSRANLGGLDPAAFDALRIDYTRLFVGVGQVLAAPWESVHFGEERLVFQQQTLHVREWYARFGLQLINLHQEPDDHIGLELEFLAHLAKLSLSALEGNDSKRFDELLQAQKQFLAEHPLKWVMLWCQLVEDNAKTDFYRAVAMLVRGSLVELAGILEIPLPPPAPVNR